MIKHAAAVALALVFSVTAVTPVIFADDSKYQTSWPQWRGPGVNGVSPNGDPPLHWSETQNVAFKVPIPGRGLASPIVWGDRIFLLTAVSADDNAYAASQQAAAEKLERQEWPPSVEPVKQRFVVMALARDDGRILWQRTAVERKPHESHYITSSWASASPLTDGKRLFAFFGSNGLFAYDLDGNLLWQRDLGDMETRSGFGEGASPAIHGDTLVINWDHEGDSFIVALDAKTGDERWRTERPGEVTSWSTPLIVEHDGQMQVVVPATGYSRGYSLATGEELWRASGMTVNSIPAPVHRQGVVYLGSGYRGNMVQAIDLAAASEEVNSEGASGELTLGKGIRWQHERHTPYVPSLLLDDHRLYFVKHFKNIVTGLDARSGEVLFTEKRLPGISNVYSSPVAAAGRLYFVGRDGNAVVLKSGDAFEVLAENRLDESFDASPAISGGDLFLRGHHHLYRISRNPSAVTGQAGLESKKTQVAVLGMIHSDHRTSPTWGLDQVRNTIRRFDPDVVCAEIPPSHWPSTLAIWNERAVVEDSRVKRFPEYTDALLPLMTEMGFSVEPCAAWTEEMAAERRARLDLFEKDRAQAERHAEYERRNAEVEARLAADPIDEDDPRVIHSALYDARIEESLGPYDEMLNDWIGAGGWTNINRAHYALIDRTIEKHRGKRILITFGAGHKYWFLRQLSDRDDIEMVDITPFLPPG
ncbi:MAG: PQQ-binding-like beta-propeller repeat protein [Deltaproteobacteria bacterium]|nr:PQQ-binding-like beta-propeller repeat protein [Deltaproteobacteria bacterium]